MPAPETTVLGDGAVIEQRWQPVGRVGLYVPGGKAVYPSSVVMNVVPAQVAGVRSVALASPPQAAFGGRVHPTILGAAALLGIDEVYAMGGAGAIGALAYGVPSLGLDPVHVVTGPGNVYVAAAKRLVRGVVGIDAEAGPTEILVIADDSADADFVAADLVSQAEHDELAAAVLVTDSSELADAVVERLAAAVAADEALRSACARRSTGAQSAIVLVDDLEQAADFANAYGPEHLEIQVARRRRGARPHRERRRDLPRAVLAGEPRRLPRGLQPRAAHRRPGPVLGRALGAATFLRPQQVVRYDRGGAARGRAPDRARCRAAEDLPAHGEAVTAGSTAA